jgi:hypothetical protein
MVEPAVADPAAVVSEKKRAPRTKFEIPDGWIARGFTFEVAWPDDPESASSIRSQFGGRRFAYNWALAQVKADMDVKKVDPSLEIGEAVAERPQRDARPSHASRAQPARPEPKRSATNTPRVRL